MCSNRSALTLLEVVAAIALLATLLVAVLTAQDRLARQTRRAELRLKAIEAADTLMASWTTTSPMLIPAARGTVNTSPPLYWRVSTGADQSLLPYGVQVATLRITASEYSADEVPLAELEFLTTAAIPLEGAQ